MEKKTEDLSKSWRSFTAAQKMPFRIAAQSEHMARSKLQEQPLPCQRDHAAASSDQQVKSKTRHRLNMQRISLNEQQRQAHPAFHGQALFDHKYALKAEHMEAVQNLTVPEISKQLCETFHKQLHTCGVNARRELGSLAVCQDRWGLCCQDKYFKPVTALVHKFNKAVSEHSLHPGDLLKFKVVSTSSGSLAASASSSEHRQLGSTVVCFLSAVVSKPFPSQVLIELSPANGNFQFQTVSIGEALGLQLAAVGPDAISWSLTEDLPICSTAASVFRKVLMQSGWVETSVAEIEMEKLKYTLNYDANQCPENVSSQATLSKFILSSTKDEVRHKPKRTYPLGLQPGKKKNRGNRAPRQTVRVVHSSAADQNASLDIVESASSQGSSNQHSSSSKKSSTSCSNDSDSNSSCGSSVSVSVSLQDEVLDQAVLVSGQSQVEESEAVSDHRLQIQTELDITSKVAKTFFGQVGIIEASLAKTSRSVCNVCHQYIEKTMLRYSYHFDPKRPSRWMHGSCLRNYFISQDNEHREQTLHDLQLLCLSSVPEVSHLVDEHLKDLIAVLNSSSSQARS